LTNVGFTRLITLFQNQWEVSMKEQEILFFPQSVWINALYMTFAEPVECVNKFGEAKLPKADDRMRVVLLLRIVDVYGNRGLAYAFDTTNDSKKFLRYFEQFSRGKWDTFECYLIDEDLLEIALKDI